MSGTFWTIVWFVIIFGIVVLSHEFGHFLLAKLNGIKVVEFSVGMGPAIFSVKRKETRYALRLFPIGGACMFEGEDGRESEDGKEAESDEGSFNKASVWARISTVLAGPVFNFILAFVVAVILVSIAAPAPNTISGVTPESPAAEAGLMEGDRIISINGEKTYLFKDISLITYLNGGNPMEIVYDRAGEEHTVTITPVYSEENGAYLMGIYGTYGEAKGLKVFQYAWYEMRYCVVNTYKSLGMLLTGKFSRQDVAGPVGIAVNVVGKTYEYTKDYGLKTVFYNMFNIVLLLSVNLGILNLLPIPALDGGRLVFLIVEVFRGKPVPPEKEGFVHFIGLVFFMILMVIVFFNDLSNIFAG
ncbi:MAG: RIP metalloprotease RseP [Lachnospiraceae bacterium]